MKFRPLSSYSRFAIPVIMLLIFNIISGCSANTPAVTRQVSVGEVQVTINDQTPTPFQFKTPVPGTITVHGLLIVLDPTNSIPASNDAIFLVPLPAEETISMIPQFEAGTVPQAEVDESTGEFVFTNLQPGQYAVVVVTLGRAQIPVRYQGTPNFAIFTLDSTQIDTTFELGNLTLP